MHASVIFIRIALVGNCNKGRDLGGQEGSSPPPPF